MADRAISRGWVWRKLSLAGRRRDANRCQICGDVAPIEYSPFGSPHAHHITPRSQQGPDSLDNIITLCDLCHAVLHPHLWRAWFPQAFSQEDAERLEETRNLFAIRDDYDWFCHLPLPERTRVQRQVWAMFGRRNAS